MHVQTIQLDRPLKNVRLTSHAFREASGTPTEEMKDLRAQVASLQTQIDRNHHADLAIAEIASQLKRIDAIRQKTLTELQQVAIEMASAIAVKICQTKIDEGSFPIENVVRCLIERLGFSQPMKVFLHPLDLEILEPGFVAQHPQNQIKLLKDPQLGRGECRAETEDAGLISTIELQAAEMRQLLWEGLDAAQSAN